jgi:hypothetical protein
MQFSRGRLSRADTQGGGAELLLEDLSGGDGARLLRRDLLFGTEPIFEVVAVFPAACLVECIRALADLDFELLGVAHRAVADGFFVGSLGMGHSFLRQWQAV